jgi:hypothetical protein
MKKIYALAVWLSVSVVASYAGQTQYTVIVVVDGARYTETFGDATHSYIPRMWNTLKPQGTLYTSFYNNGLTETCPGHATIVSGAWQNIANTGSERPHTPTIFEYYRKEDGAAAKDNYVVLGKTKLSILQYSDYAGYGSTYSASKSQATTESSDLQAADSIKAVLRRHPRMTIVNLPAVDYAGHAGVMANYLSAIRTADSLVNVIWTTIQADPVLANKTTLFVTNDHGRHTTNFASHGDNCEGCRHIMLLVLGPDTPADTIDTATYQQIDIAPTIGNLIDFSLPYATGSVITSAISKSTNSAPVASNVAVSGTPTVGQVLTAAYTYSDADGDAEGVTTFRWFRNGTAIAGATSRTYTLTTADIGAMIKVEVTPVALTGTSPGTAVQSPTVGPVIDNSPAKPIISGTTGVGTVTLSYTDTTAKTATSDGSGAYAFTVSVGWSGTVTPGKTGYGFTPTVRTYTNVTADQTLQDYAAAAVPVLSGFVVEAETGGAIPRQRPGVAFSIKVTAVDGDGHTLTSFTGSVNITSSGTLSAGGGATANFVAGVLASHSVTLTSGGVYTITATKPATLETGTSSSFTVSRIFFASNAGNDATGDGTLTKPFLTIVKGVTTALAGDTVQALAGTYVEAVNVTKSLVLLGSGASTTTIEAPSDFATSSAYDYALANFTTERAIVHIGTTNPIAVTMKGFTVDGKSRGPALAQAVAYSGILAEQCTVSVMQNTVKNILPSDPGSIWDEARLYNGRGIDVRGNGTVAVIDGNTLEEINRFYILVNAGEDTSLHATVFPCAVVKNNTITGKGVYAGGQKGVWFNTGAWGTITGNTITNLDYVDAAIEPERASAIVVRYGYLDPTHHRVISNNTVTTTTAINNKGLYLQSIGDTVAGNTFSGFRWGAEVHDASLVTLCRNSITGGRVGVLVTTEHDPGTADIVTIGGSPANRNTITGQDIATGGFAISLGFRDEIDEVTFRSSIPVDARYNDFGVYTEGEIAARIWDRTDTTMADVDVVLYTPFYGMTVANVEVLLEGPYAGSGTMTTLLRTAGYIPLTQPYSVAPWSYTGTEFVTSIPAGVVDWVLLELRTGTAAATTVGKRAAFLKSDGTIVDVDGTSAVMFGGVAAGNYYVVVRHRNHLAVMSAGTTALSSLSTQYDFTTGPEKYYGGEAKALPGGKYGLFAGDVTGDGAVVLSGEVTAIRASNLEERYDNADVNMDGAVVLSSELTVVRANNLYESNVP